MLGNQHCGGLEEKRGVRRRSVDVWLSDHLQISVKLDRRSRAGALRVDAWKGWTVVWQPIANKDLEQACNRYYPATYCVREIRRPETGCQRLNITITLCRGRLSLHLNWFHPSNNRGDARNSRLRRIADRLPLTVSLTGSAVSRMYCCLAHRAATPFECFPSVETRAESPHLSATNEAFRSLL